MKAKIFKGSPHSIEMKMNDFFEESKANVKHITQSLLMETETNPILIVTVIYE